MGWVDCPLRLGGTSVLLRVGKGPLGIPSFICVAMGPVMFIVVTTCDLFIEFIVFMVLILVTVFMPPAMPLFAMLLWPMEVLVLTRLMEETAPLEAIDMDMVPDTVARELAILLGMLFMLFTESFILIGWLDVGTPLIPKFVF